MEQKVTINRYIRKIQLSKARRIKYYEKNKARPKAKKYQDVLKYGYKQLAGLGNRSFLVEFESNLRVIANPKAAGTPRFQMINGQDIYNGNVAKHTRNKIVSAIKDQFKPYIKTLVPVKDYPIEITLSIEGELGGFDLDNRSGPYLKCTQDLLTEETIIEDDNVNFIRRIILEFIPIENEEDRTLTLTIKSLC